MSRALDHGNRCPMCRTVVFMNGDTTAVSITLKSIIEKAFPQENDERRQELLEEAAGASVGTVLPLFVMDVVLPGQAIALNIFEPRYRLMVRRCMDGNRRMGMAVLEGENLATFAVELEIIECEPLPDGRFFLELRARRRVRILEAWQQDGYRVGRVEEARDEAEADGEAAAGGGEGPKPSLPALAEEVDGLVEQWLKRARTYDGRRARELVNRAGTKPPYADPEAFGFWVLSLLPLPSGEKLRLLSTTSSRVRLDAVKEVLASNDPRSCTVQ
mmetsp:Transcript_68947/g.218030  ORF Transcript_68947/g.218030 Transcript_68947/m.218030 type:complete len:273 (+) Transcript_68947:303-1121(+)